MSRRRPGPDPRREAALAGWRVVADHPMLGGCGGHITPAADGELDPHSWILVGPDGWIRYDHGRTAEPAAWTWMFAHGVLHLGLGHTDPRRADPGEVGADVGVRRGTARLPAPAYAAACCVAVDRWLRQLRVGDCPYPLAPQAPEDDEETLARRWRTHGVPPGAAPGAPDFLIGDEDTARRLDFPRQLGVGISAAAGAALDVAGRRSAPGGRGSEPWHRALSWFVSAYPLLGALAAGMRVVADAGLSRQWHIAVAAVSPEAAEIYVNPMTRLSVAEWRFVLAHELLHAALRHDARVGGRDPYTWNVACDYVVNGWLVEMGVGELPEGLLYDPQLTGLSCEAVYDRTATDLRRVRRLSTPRGRGAADIIDAAARPDPRPFVDLDRYYRDALAQGLSFHRRSGRGLVPAGLEEDIWALEQPAPPWDVALADWFAEHVPGRETRRSYGRRSRRQSASPDIPRPGRVRPAEPVPRATFGVVLDTSGSMDRALLGKALGAVAAYAGARDVPRVRVVFCDAAAHDAGYLEVTAIAERVRVRGRGGTRLQPGIDLLERAEDFPPDGPILVITDGRCDAFRIRRPHAVLVPAGTALPSRPRGPVLYLS
jgi:predicted metal-dependent peptidase